MPSCACVPADAAALPMVCMMRDAETPIERSASDARGCRPHFRMAASGVATGGRLVSGRSCWMALTSSSAVASATALVPQVVDVVVDHHVVGLERFVVVEERSVVVDGLGIGGDERRRLRLRRGIGQERRFLRGELGVDLAVVVDAGVTSTAGERQRQQSVRVKPSTASSCERSWVTSHASLCSRVRPVQQARCRGPTAGIAFDGAGCSAARDRCEPRQQIHSSAATAATAATA